MRLPRPEPHPYNVASRISEVAVGYRADVIIVGGGIAGIVTALGLLDRHQSVLLLERQGPTGLGGLAHWALGGIFLVDTPLQRKVGVKDSTELAFSDWL